MGIEESTQIARSVWQSLLPTEPSHWPLLITFLLLLLFRTHLKDKSTPFSLSLSLCLFPFLPPSLPLSPPNPINWLSHPSLSFILVHTAVNTMFLTHTSHMAFFYLNLSTGSSLAFERALEPFQICSLPRYLATSLIVTVSTSAQPLMASTSGIFASSGFSPGSELAPTPHLGTQLQFPCSTGHPLISSLYLELTFLQPHIIHCMALWCISHLQGTC